MGDSNKLAASDDEEDLEALRLAALQSLKKKNEALNGISQLRRSLNINSEKRIRYNNRSMKAMQNKRGRFFGLHQGRNTQFNNRVRNTNLISIPTIPSEEENIEENKSHNSEAKLTLPQDRYCGKEKQEEKSGEGTSKFTRYDKSDKSESESEAEETVSSEDDSPGKLKKANSLEALMEELDAEIQGKTIVKEEKPAKEEKAKKKTKKKKRTSSEAVSTSDSDAKACEQKEDKANVECDKNVEVTNPEKEKSDCETTETENKVQKIDSSVREDVENGAKVDETYSPMKKRLRSRSPMTHRGFNRRRRGNFHKFANRPPPNCPPPFVPPPVHYPAPMIPFPNQPFNTLFCPPALISQPPPFFDRPLSPLAINTESLTTATLAPLSPRSAAFVMQNKAIIERRRRSPRRSYSRSPSRSPRRSLTPRRSPRRSITPRRISRSPRRLSRSPRRRSLSPRRRSLSPRRKTVGKSTDNSPKNKPPVRDRLGVKPNKAEESKEKKEPIEASPKKEDEKPLDPVLEARKRKFESNEIKMKEGIIRLRPKDEKLKENPPPTQPTLPVQPPVAVALQEKPTQTEEEKPCEPKDPDEFEELEKLLNEDLLLGDITLDPKVDDIFSDDDSTSDNEGRFKVKQQTSNKVPVLSFTKLVNGEKKEIKPEPLPDSTRKEKRNRFDRRRSRGRSPADRKGVKEDTKEDDRKKSAPKKSEGRERAAKSRTALKSDRHVAAIEKRFERKIEIKIKNPSKYERGGKLKFSKDGDERTPEKVKRKVELGSREEEEEEEVKRNVVVHNESGDEENAVISEVPGDLRAQLSKKRAEKLHRKPIEVVSSRLLQSALQGAVFKEAKKKTKDQDISSSDGKLPVYLRLGIANSSDIFADTKVKRKSRKRKTREVLEQVYFLLLRHYTSQF